MTSPAYAPAAASLKNEPIDINKEASLNYWVAALACSELELRVAVAEVGPAAKDVSNELGRAVMSAMPPNATAAARAARGPRQRAFGRPVLLGGHPAVHR